MASVWPWGTRYKAIKMKIFSGENESALGYLLMVSSPSQNMRTRGRNENKNRGGLLLIIDIWRGFQVNKTTRS